MTNNIYETNRLYISPLNQDFAALVLSFYEDNKSHFEPWEPQRSPNFYTLSYQKASLAAECNQMTEGKLLRFWIFTKENPEEIIGSICFQNIMREPYHSCCLGYKFSHRYLRQGYAKESIQKCLDIIFEEHQLHRVEAYIMPSNLSSRRLVERLSFQFEGLSASFVKIGGLWTDHMRYALINPKC